MKNKKIAEANDAFRKKVTQAPTDTGRLLLTRGAGLLAENEQRSFLRLIGQPYESFSTDGDNPYGENDFASFEYLGEKCFWKIDYFEDSKCEYGAEDPEICYRVLTVWLASEY